MSGTTEKEGRLEWYKDGCMRKWNKRRDRRMYRKTKKYYWMDG